MVVVPYRSKNPPEHTPYVTYTLIAMNCLVFIFTSNWHGGPHIRLGILQDWGVSMRTMNPVRSFTALFLHANLLHIGGNMLFLWIFGVATEGRLRPWKYLAVYFAAGMVGGYIQCMSSPQLAIGASGAIMGIAGAYVYMFPHAKIRVFRWLFLRPYIDDWPAWGTVGYFFFFDVLDGVILRVRDGVGHYWHISGLLIGVAMVWILKARRDTEAISEVQATRCELSNELELMSYGELDVLMDAWTDNMDMVLVYCNKAIAHPGSRGEQKAVEAIERYKDELLEHADPEWLASTVLKIPRDATKQLPGPFYLKLGGKLEAAGKYETAAVVYRRIFDIDQSTMDASAAIMRFGRIWETIFHDMEMARDAYEVYMRLFPSGSLAEEAEKGLERVGGARFVAQIIRQTTIKRTFLADDDEPAPRIAAFDDDPTQLETEPARDTSTGESGDRPDQAKLSVPNPFAGD